jgi:hypothetical protein
LIFSYGNLLSLISCFFDAKLIIPEVFLSIGTWLIS